MGNMCHHVGIFTNNPEELIRFYFVKDPEGNLIEIYES
jgi:catechol 2,3-dioxygenase-like lactoylglutathione lyase family enzyme